MSETQFKTPLKYTTPKTNGHSIYFTPQTTDKSDSEESTGSTDTGSTASSSDLTIVAVFDDLLRVLKHKRAHKAENTLLDIIEQSSVILSHYREAVQECRRLQSIVEVKTHEQSDLENKLGIARKLLDQEKKNTRQAEKERDNLELQIALVRELLFKDKSNQSRLPDETREKLAFLNNTSTMALNGQDSKNVGPVGHLSAIQEVNSTGSILSDFSFSRSEDDLDSSKCFQTGKEWKKHRPSTGGVPEPAYKKRRSSGNRVVEINASDAVRATTTLTVTKEGPITATSVIESIPTPGPKETSQKEYPPSAPPANLVFESWARESPLRSEKNNLRPHTLQQKMSLLPEPCTFCNKRVRFGKSCYKCKDCKAILHVECKDSLALPCIPQVNTPNQNHIMGIISDYTPTIPPMVPALIVHCVNEVELRGLTEIGIYRIPGPEKDVKMLKEKFLRGRCPPCIKDIDIHVICGTVKDFLRSLSEPIVTHTLWRDFVNSVENNEDKDIPAALYQVISELPQPNRDTLAYMVVHLQKVSKVKVCKMPLMNLAKIFGPTIVGYSSDDPDPGMLLTETRQQVHVMESLMELPTDYWTAFINVNHTLQTPSGKLQQTPSTDSLLQFSANRGGMFTPNRNNNTFARRKQKFFGTPPYHK